MMEEEIRDRNEAREEAVTEKNTEVPESSPEKEKQVEEDERTEEGKRAKEDNSTRGLLQILVGMYLLYTCWSLKDAASASHGKEKVLIIAAIILFAVSGVFLLGKNLRSMLKSK